MIRNAWHHGGPTAPFIHLVHDVHYDDDDDVHYDDVHDEVDRDGDDDGTHRPLHSPC